MSELTTAVPRRPRRVRLAIAALVAVAAPTLVWIGRSSAGPGSVHAQRAAATKTAANVPTNKADVVSLGGDIPCTVSPNFTDMPGTFVTFKLGGSAPRPVIVMLQGQWFMPNEGVDVRIRLLVDGSMQTPTNVLMAQRPTGNSLTDGTHGFDFVTDPLTPGTHTAKIQWHDNGVNQGCITNRTLTVLHK